MGKLVKDMKLEEFRVASIVSLSPASMWIMPYPDVDLYLLEWRQKEGPYEAEVFQVMDLEYMGLG